MGLGFLITSFNWKSTAGLLHSKRNFWRHVLNVTPLNTSGCNLLKDPCKKALVCWNQMQLEILTLEMWWANTCRRIIRKACPGRRDNGGKGTAWCCWSNCFVGEWRTACRSSVGQAVLQQRSPVRSDSKELPCGCFRKCFIWFNPSHHYKARFKILKETKDYLCFCSLWSLTTLQVIQAQPAWSRQQCLRTLCALCGCALVRLSQRKSTSFLLNWET